MGLSPSRQKCPLLPALTMPQRGTLPRLFRRLTERHAGRLVSACRGEFAAFCRAAGRMPETVKSRINELATELVGDIVLDDGFNVIGDYADELFAALTEYKEDTD